MKLAVDVHYSDSTANVAGVAFSSWEDQEPEGTFTCTVEDIAPYIPGEFYKRELPCILALLQQYDLKPEYIIIDGFVYLDNNERPGLGKHLYDTLNGRVKVIGVAKKPYKIAVSGSEVYRGKSENPLFVTSIGVSQDQAKSLVKSMHGDFRIPTLLKRCDQLSRS